jgi:tetratricopeptide (TPR) repeat protein
MRQIHLAASLSLMMAGLSGRAIAGEAADPRVKARAAYEQAERAAASLDFQAALAGYEEAASVDPSGPLARIARARANDLSTHAEGRFAPLARLEAVRRKSSPERAEIDALAADAEGFPPGRVRAEARLVVAEALWHRFDDKAAAARALDAALADDSADKLTRSLALHELVALERERGDLFAAHRAVERFPDLAPSLLTEISRLVRRVFLARLSTVIVAVAAAIGLASVVRLLRRDLGDVEGTIRRTIRPSAVAFALYLGGAAAILVHYHGDGDVRPFLWLGLGVLGVSIVAHAWRLGSRDDRAFAKLGRALFCGLAVLAVAFLSLERANAGYLESFGL